MAELRGMIQKTAMEKLHRLKDHLGYRRTIEVVEFLVHHCFDDLMQTGSFYSDRSRAYKILKSRSTTAGISPEDIVRVNKSEAVIEIWLRLEAAPVPISGRDWERQ